VPSVTAETTLSTEPERPLPRPTGLLIATDGTPQSDAAIALARLLPLGGQREFKVLTVVAHAPIPWGTVDRSLVMEYERGQQQEAVALLDEALAIARESDVGFHLLDRIYGTRVAAAPDPASALAALASRDAGEPSSLFAAK